MKAVMYHYIHDKTYPYKYPHFLSIYEFRKQLDYFSTYDRVLSKNELLDIISSRIPVPDDGVILTFDDGLLDCYNFVFPELLSRKLFGIFYIPTNIFKEGQLLDVHKIHLILGSEDGVRLLKQAVSVFITSSLMQKINTDFPETYKYQSNSYEVTEIKKILNYAISPKKKSIILREVMTRLGLDEKVISKAIYLSKDNVLEMHRSGMLFGGHSVTHCILSRQTTAQQRKEIAESFAVLRDLLGENIVKTFSYPYGRIGTFNNISLKILREIDCKFSFAVSHRNISNVDIINNIQQLPRWDCSQFI